MSIDKKQQNISKQNKMLLEYIQKTFDKDKSYEIFNIVSRTFWLYSTSPKDFTKALSTAKRGNDLIFRTAKIYLELMIENNKLDKIINDAADKIKV